MRIDTARAAATMANFLPGLISGTQLEFFAKANITNSQFITLITIFYSGRCTMGYLAKSLHVKMPTVTGLVNRLIKLNLVKRSASQNDRRKVYIELSSKGKALITGFKTLVRNKWANVLIALSPAEIKDFQKVLEKLSRNIGNRKNENSK